MKKIMYARLQKGFCDEAGYHYTECYEAEYGEEWGGDVKGYIENLDIDFDYEIAPADNFTIHEIPEDALVVVIDGEPLEMWWAEEKGEDQKEKITNYSELVNYIESCPYPMSRFNVVSYLIGLNGSVDENDWDNIMRLFADGFVGE